MSQSRMNRVGFTLATSSLFLSWLGCGYSYVATTPGARPLILESPEVAEPGAVAISGQATFRNEDEQDSEQENSMIGSGKVRVGVGGSTELQLEAQYRGTLGRPRSVTAPSDTMQVHWADFTDRSGIAGRVGFRSAIVQFRSRRVVTVGAGLGVGALPRGTHLSPEFVVSGGFENDFIVPFFNFRVGIGIPVNARLTLEGRDSQNVAQTFSPSYETTLFTSFDLGARVPLVQDGSVRPSLLFGGGMGYDFRLTDGSGRAARPTGIDGPVGTVVYQVGLALELLIGDAPDADQS